jgi:SAM-dependent methyltransferase
MYAASILIGGSMLPASVLAEAKPHTAVYRMHKYFARRPWNIFRELISLHTSPGDLILDPFLGGGVTVVEAMRLKRRVVGVDVNPLAVYVTKNEVRPVQIEQLEHAIEKVSTSTKELIKSLYVTRCPQCKTTAHADWIEWNESDNEITRLKFDCARCCSSGVNKAAQEDTEIARRIDRRFNELVEQHALWFPQTRIPSGDKTNSLIRSGVTHFHQLFTKRNILALGILLKEIGQTDFASQDFLKFVISSCLKWSSRQSHLRGKIVEGWALHAYWIYPTSLEINVWNTFERRVQAAIRGKRYSNEEIGNFCKFASNFDELAGAATCLLLNYSSTNLHIPDNSIDAIITDPPYGGNVNYGELSDFWWVWLSHGHTTEKLNEAIVNKSQHKSLLDYEKTLAAIFTECFRVLKPGKSLVSTFNSRDARVVSAFLGAVSKSGFTIHPRGVIYQTPIRAYNTTFHAMQIGAFVGDFIFTFTKPINIHRNETSTDRIDLTDFEHELNDLITKNVHVMTETQLREETYRFLIPFIAKYSVSSPEACRSAAALFEKKMRDQSVHFKHVRETTIKSRRRTFRKGLKS